MNPATSRRDPFVNGARAFLRIASDACNPRIRAHFRVSQRPTRALRSETAVSGTPALTLSNSRILGFQNALGERDRERWDPGPGGFETRSVVGSVPAHLDCRAGWVLAVESDRVRPAPRVRRS